MAQLLTPEQAKKLFDKGLIDEPTYRKAVAKPIEKEVGPIDTGAPKPIPALRNFRDKINEGIQERIVNPFYQRGYENLGPAVGAGLSAAAEVVLPETGFDFLPAAGTMRDVSKLKKTIEKSGADNVRMLRPENEMSEAFDKVREKGAQEPFPRTSGNIHKVPDQKNDHDPIFRMKQRLRDAYTDQPEWLKKFDELETKGYDEPYFGKSIDNALYGTAKPIKPANQLPIFNVPDVKGHLGKRVAKGGADPFAWMDTKYGATKEVLRRNADKPLKISTRSDLIAHDDYMEHLNPKLHEVNFHIFSDNNRINRVAVPGGPSISRLVKAADKLARRGIKVTFVLDRVEGVRPDFNNLNELKDLGLEAVVPGTFSFAVNVIKPTKEIKKKLNASFGQDLFAKGSVDDIPTTVPLKETRRTPSQDFWEKARELDKKRDPEKGD